MFNVLKCTYFNRCGGGGGGGIHKRPRSRNPTFRNAASRKTPPDPRAGQE